MKKLMFTFAFTFICLTLSAQNTFEKIMSEKISKVQQTRSIDELTSLANDFSRIAEKEKTQWLPYYYASLVMVQKGRTLMMAGKTNELDEVAGDAEKFLDKSIELSPENPENYIISKMIHSLKMMVNPQQRYMTEGALASEALSKAEKLDPQNPRITLLKAEDLFYTPEQFGGSKLKAIELFAKAKEQYAAYKTKSVLDPNWGKEEAEYFLSQK